MAGHVPVVPMDRGNNTTCTINLHGATIVSWRVNNQARLRAVVGEKSASNSGQTARKIEAALGPHAGRNAGHKGLVKMSLLQGSNSCLACNFVPQTSGLASVWQI